MYFLVNLFNAFHFKVFATNMKSIEYKQTVCTMHIDKNRRNRTTNGEFQGSATGLQRLFQLYCSLTHSTWYNTTSRVGPWVQPWSRPGKVQKYCGMHTPSNKHCNVQALSCKVKCGCSVQRIRTNINNLTASKRATLRCWTFCIVQERGSYFSQ